MGNIRIMKADSIHHNFVDGLSHQPMMSDANDEAKLYQCILKAGYKWTPELFKKESGTGKIQMFFFISGAGYIAAETESWQISEQGVFVPNFDQEHFCIYAGQKDLHFVHITGVLNDYDIRTMHDWCIKLPRFRTYDQCTQYTEGFTGDAGSNVKSRLLIEGRGCGRWSMGWNDGIGPSFIGQHVHPFLEQWYYVLPGGSFTYLADGINTPMEEGDLSYTEQNTYHGSETAEGRTINYFWLELATNGYPEGPDKLPGLALDMKP